MLLLAGDIGGTKTLLGLYDYDPDARPASPPRELERARFGSKEHPSLEAVLELFLHGRSVAVAVFAVAGPIVGGRWKGTNFAWELDVPTLCARLNAPVALLNDLEAAVYGLAELRDEELHVLAPGQRDPGGPIAMIAAGTGLGEAIAIPLPDGRLRVLASEGGHSDFAARNALEIALLQVLFARHKTRISVERAVSGPGLVALHDFVLAEGLVASDPDTCEQMRSGDPGEVIARRGERNEDAACARALDLFVALYGAEAGNLALKVLPTGGLYVAGATAQKLASRLERGDFMAAFLDKGRMAPLLGRLPVLLVLQPDLGLLGARAHAAGICRTNLAQ
jgi:glucokinase